ncbi:MAG TPA: hypothetical protein VFD84_00605 [Candidatus Binatia bacterium]|nr:hypothetical protein [Candidatus Binatia bacterium]
MSKPPRPGGGWLVQLGTLQTRTDRNGLFTLDVPAGAPLAGSLFHPSDSQTETMPFRLGDLFPSARRRSRSRSSSRATAPAA